MISLDFASLVCTRFACFYSQIKPLLLLLLAVLLLLGILHDVLQLVPMLARRQGRRVQGDWVRDKGGWGMGWGVARELPLYVIADLNRR